MNRLSLWFYTLGKPARTALVSILVLLLVGAGSLIAYMIAAPKKVEVRYGTIVWDPLDGHVWEDNTQTAMVDPSEAADYRVEYIVKYSPEHEEQIRKAQEEQIAEQESLETSTGLEALETALPEQQMRDIMTLQQNIEVMGQDVISGMEMAGEISDIKSTLVDYRNQVASLPLPPELESLRQEVLQIFDRYIAACDYYLQAIATGDLTYVDRANALIDEANAMIQGLVPSYPSQ
jgi:hypothetical protein